MPRQRYSGSSGASGLKAERKDSGLKGALFVVHGYAQACAVLAAATACGVPVVLMSAPAAAGYAGPGWFRALIDVARSAHPGARSLAILDCGDLPGRALAAIRAGVEAITLRGPNPTIAKVAAIAARSRCRLVRAEEIDTLGPAIDLRLESDTAIASRLKTAQEQRRVENAPVVG